MHLNNEVKGDEGPGYREKDDGWFVYFVILVGIIKCLYYYNGGGKKGMEAEEKVVEVDLSGNFGVDKIAVDVVNKIEEKARKIEGQKIKIETLNASSLTKLPFQLPVDPYHPVERNRPRKKVPPSDNFKQSSIAPLFHSIFIFL